MSLTKKLINQINRANAQKSTGPRSEEGKLISSQNALKSGLDAESQIVHGETPEAFAQLQTEYYDRFKPATPEERFQLDSLIRHEWFLRRFFRVEAQLWDYHASKADPSTGVTLGEAFSKASPIFMRLHRRITAAEKAHKEAMAELKRLQASRQPQESNAKLEEFASFLQAEMDPPNFFQDPASAGRGDAADPARSGLLRSAQE